MMIKACIFDLDGVIVDSAKYHFTAWQELANSLGISFTKEQNEDLKGVSRMDSLNYILKLGSVELSQEEKEKLAASKNDRYLQYVDKMDKSEILPGVEEFIRECREASIKIALGSSSKNARPILEKTNLIDLFEVIVDGNNTINTKPDPEVFIKGATKLKVKAEETVVFEDSIKGIRAANKAYFRSIGIGEWHTLIEADYVIPGFENFKLTDLKEIF